MFSLFTGLVSPKRMTLQSHTFAATAREEIPAELAELGKANENLLKIHGGVLPLIDSQAKTVAAMSDAVEYNPQLQPVLAAEQAKLESLNEINGWAMSGLAAIKEALNRAGDLLALNLRIGQP